MTSIPQVVQALQMVLTTIANQAGRASDFIVREVKLRGSTFVQILVFSFLADPHATLEALAQTAAALGVRITQQALALRFTETAAACLEQVLAAVVAQVIAAAPLAVPILERFAAVEVQDSTTITLPAALGAGAAGGGRPAAATLVCRGTAAWRHAEYRQSGPGGLDRRFRLRVVRLGSAHAAAPRAKVYEHADICRIDVSSSIIPHHHVWRIRLNHTTSRAPALLKRTSAALAWRRASRRPGCIHASQLIRCAQRHGDPASIHAGARRSGPGPRDAESPRRVATPFRLRPPTDGSMRSRKGNGDDQRYCRIASHDHPHDGGRVALLGLRRLCSPRRARMQTLSALL